ncbi:MAG: HD domain-containing protein [Labilithrix sp.]|nr:HD domain-containing protein [Labilithrix sp.]MCW5809595.1 HD domain-containing protein [Labilithrix sp.]
MDRPPLIPRGIDASLWLRLRDEAAKRAEGTEPAHDFAHVERVLVNAVTIARAESANEAVAGAAALLHELFNLPKSHPDSAKAGDLCAEHARALLVREEAPAALVDPVCAAIRDHSFSKGVVPAALESRVLQDADRLDAIGAIGLARMWATCADMKRPFYAPSDPFCRARAPDDKQWGLDHVFKKLLQIPSRLHLATSKRLARERVAFLHVYMDQLRSEIGEAEL